VIDLLNRHFVPVYSANEDVSPEGSASPEEKTEWQRIYSAFASRHMPFGDVHFYILTPDAQPFDGITVNGLTTEAFIAVLEKTIRALEIKPGPALVKPAPQSLPPPHSADALVFQVIARGSKVGSYREFPSENWIVFSRDEARRILPSGAIRPGQTWDIERPAAVRWLAKFYPQGIEINSADRGRIDQYSLRATVLTLENGAACARIDGRLVMKQPFTPGHDDDNFVRATLLGFVNFNVERREIQALRLVTTKAFYGPGSGDEDFKAVLRSMSPEALRQYAGAEN
jgi:hypothetical protein